MEPRHLGVIVGPVVTGLKYLTSKVISLLRARAYFSRKSSEELNGTESEQEVFRIVREVMLELEGCC